MDSAHPQPVNLLSYRPWHGQLAGPRRAVWAIARLGVAGLIRRKLFWLLFALSGFTFCSFFFGQYLLIWAEGQLNEEFVRAGPFPVSPANMVKDLREMMKFNGSGQTFRNLFFLQGLILTVALVLAGAQLVGNDFRYRSLPFYLSKPLRGRHYVIGKCLTASAVINLMTTLPAMILLIEYGLLTKWIYFWESRWLALGILGYGAVLSVVLSLLLVAVTSLVKKTVPLVMVWAGLFVFVPGVVGGLATWLQEPNLHLFDIWNNTYVVGNWLLGESLVDQPQPWAAAAVLFAVCMVCIFWLHRRIRAVEVV